MYRIAHIAVVVMIVVVAVVVSVSNVGFEHTIGVAIADSMLSLPSLKVAFTTWCKQETRIVQLLLYVSVTLSYQLYVSPFDLWYRSLLN